MTAKSILDLLADKHLGDVFVPECKDGPSYGGGMSRMDAWAMNKSWAHPLTVAYEIKVSRADYLKDNKWPAYLPYCNQFYFVCPAGLIDVSEMSPDAGLMYVSKTGRILITKKKAPYRDVQVPESIWRYILMCRAKIGPETYDHGFDKVEKWRQFAEKKTEYSTIGRNVAKRIREHVEAVERRNLELEDKFKAYDDIREFLKNLGIDPSGYVYQFNVEQKLREINELFPPWFVTSLEQIEGHSKSILNHLNGIHAKECNLKN